MFRKVAKRVIRRDITLENIVFPTEKTTHFLNIYSSETTSNVCEVPRSCVQVQSLGSDDEEILGLEARKERTGLSKMPRKRERGRYSGERLFVFFLLVFFFARAPTRFLPRRDGSYAVVLCGETFP